MATPVPVTECYDPMMLSTLLTKHQSTSNIWGFRVVLINSELRFDSHAEAITLSFELWYCLMNWILLATNNLISEHFCIICSDSRRWHQQQCLLWTWVHLLWPSSSSDLEPAHSVQNTSVASALQGQLHCYVGPALTSERSSWDRGGGHGSAPETGSSRRPATTRLLSLAPPVGSDHDHSPGSVLSS